MPPPASFIDITSVPFTRVVTQAEFNVANEIWFRYVAAIPITLGTQTNSGGTFLPVTAIFQSNGTTVQKLPVTGIKGLWSGLLSVQDYYIKVTNNSTGSTDFDFTFTADTSPLDDISLVVGDYIINNDDNLPGTLLDSTGAIKTFLSNFPGGETAAILPDNTTVWHDAFAIYSATDFIAVFDSSLTYIGSLFSGASLGYQPIFAVDLTNNQFYMLDQSNKLWTISTSGVKVDTGYTLVETNIWAMAVNEDGTKLYYVEKDNDPIHVIDLTDGSVLPDLYTIPGFGAGDRFANTLFDQPGDMFTMSDGNVVTWWHDDSTSTYHIIIVDSGGSLINSWDYASPVEIDHLAYINGDSAHVLIWLFPFGTNEVQIGRLTLATGVIDNDFTQNSFLGGVNTIGPEKFGLAHSCTMLRVQDAPTPPPEDTGTIIINKVTTPSGLSQSFDFNAFGLTPDTFSLVDGGSRTYLNVPISGGTGGSAWAAGALADGSWAAGAWAGGSSGPSYSITETPIAGYTTTYVVSNGSSHLNITVGVDEIVTITVTNVLTSTQPGGGIYKIDPSAHKRNDTIWEDDFSGTYDVKIPNPFGISGTIGD